MNQQQRKYAMSRVSSILREKEEGLREKYYTPAVTLTSEGVQAALSAGEFSVKSNPGYRSGVRAYVDFHAETLESFDQAAFDAEVAPFRQKAAECHDQIMLGDSEEALELIKQFSEL